MMIALALVLYVADTRGRKSRTLDRLTLPHAVAFGFAQACALIPGVSRSGGTITAGLLMGYTREAATRYSFLLAIPAVLVSGLYEATKIGSGPAPAWGPTLLATGIAFAIGYAVIAWLIRYVSTRTFLPFVIYRLALGTLVLLLLATGVLAA
jgi:undecaprenyl-diphosphatase